MTSILESSSSSSICTGSSHSLCQKLLRTFLPVALIPLMLAGGIATVITYRQATRQATLKLQERANLAAEFTSRELNHTLDFLKILAVDPLVLEAVTLAGQQAEETGLTTLPIEVLEARFADRKRLSSDATLTDHLNRIAPLGGFAELFVTERHGLNVVYTRPTSDFVQRDEDWWQQGQQRGMWIGHPIFDESSQTVTIDLIYAIRNAQNGEFLGVIKGGYDAANLDFLVKELEKLHLKQSEQLQILRLGESATAIATLSAEGLTSTQTLLIDPAILQQVVAQTSPQATPGAGQPLAVLTHDGKQYAIAHIPNTDWLVVVAANLSEIHATANQMAWLFGLIVLGLGILAHTIARKLAYQLSSPLSDLAHTAQQVTDHADFSLRATVLSRDEVGIVAQAFNRLLEWTGNYINDLKAARQNLEEQTQALSQTLGELQQTQLQLVQHEKMSTLGELVAGIAHEINNPLGFIKGNLGCLKDYAKDLLDHLQLYQQVFGNSSSAIADHAEAIDLDFLTTDLSKTLSSMHEGVDRIQDISHSLRTFARADNTQTMRFDVHDGLDSTLLILRHRLKANEYRPAIEIHKLYGDLPEIHCFPGQLNQVFMNILANAIDALEDSNQGKSFEDLEAQPNRITIQTASQPADASIMITLTDNGSGIPEAIQCQIFDNLFTTKPVGKGTGLGLAIARQIVEEKHRGTLSCQSQVNQGTTFMIQLPVQVNDPLEGSPDQVSTTVV